VRRDSQILICPGCQATDDWMTDLDRCSVCSSLHLVRRLGEVECRDCGAILPPAGEQAADGPPPGDPRGSAASAVPGHGPGQPEETAPGLSEEVARALDRVLSQSVVSQSIQRAGRTGSGGPARAPGPGGERHHAGSVSPGAATG
jgi:hypothetical protein